MIKSPMVFSCRAVCVLIALLVLAPSCRAISEENYATTYKTAVLPFLNSGQRFNFPSADGKYALSGIRFLHPHAKGMIVVVNGFSQSWLQYGELFYDLYHQGYSVISYDHRGQGLSPHLVPFNSQIGYVRDFSEYSDDLDAFMEHVVKPLHPGARGLFLIAHSMGAAVATEYLELHSASPPFEAAVFCAPMYQITTAPYPEWLAQTTVGTAHLLGLGQHYAIGKHDYDPKEPFKSNKVTQSFARWQQNQQTKTKYPEIVIGGPSNEWVNTSLSKTRRIRSKEAAITVSTLLLEAGKDQLVGSQAESQAGAMIPHSRLILFPESQHEILMEKDTIRDKALSEIERFFADKEH